MEIPKLRENHLRVFDGAEGRYSVFVTDTKRAFSIGAKEKQIFDLLDGKHSLDEIKATNLVSHEDLYELIHRFRESGFLEDSAPVIKKNFLKVKFGIFCPNAFLQEHPRLVRGLSALISHLSFPFFLMALFLVRRDIASLSMVDVRNSINMSSILLFSISSFFALLFHELSHAIEAKRHGANVAEIGIMLYVFLPCAYCTLCSMENIRSLRKRCSVYLAGINCNLLLSGIVLLLCVFLQGDFFEKYAIPLVFTNLIPALINCIFLMKYDCYFLICDVLQEPYLRERSFQYLKSIISIQRPTVKASPSQKMVYLTYGLLSTVYLLLLPIIMLLAIFIE